MQRPMTHEPALRAISKVCQKAGATRCAFYFTLILICSIEAQDKRHAVTELDFTKLEFE